MKTIDGRIFYIMEQLAHIEEANRLLIMNMGAHDSTRTTSGNLRHGFCSSVPLL